jgi:hypothetical protein
MWIRERLWVTPLYGVDYLRERPCLHRAILLALDLFVVLLAVAAFYGLGLLTTWALFYHFRSIESTVDTVNFLVYSVGGSLLGLSLIGLLFLSVCGLAFLAYVCYNKIADDSYLQPSTTTEYTKV